MYTREFWDNIYNNHFQDAPWMNDMCKSKVFKLIDEIVSPLLEKNRKTFALLDYGCGNGHMGLLFSKKKIQVDLSDISIVLVNKLKQEYANEANVNIYETETPDDLPKGKKYNVIIVRNVFHHLNPNVWYLFLEKFCERLKPDGLLLVSGWDKEDEIIKQDKNKARYTNHETWCINDLPNYLNGLSLVVDMDKMLEVNDPSFDATRRFRFFTFKNNLNLINTNA